MPISGCRASIRLVLSVQVMASSLTGAASFYAATAQQAIAAAVPPSPRPWLLKVVSWNTGPARDRGPTILWKLREAGVVEEFDVILLQELPGQWANPMTPEEVKDLLHQVFPADHWWILVLRHLVTVVRKALTSADMADMPTQVEVRLFPHGSGKAKWWRFVQEVSRLGSENLRCDAFAFCVPFVCCLRSGGGASQPITLIGEALRLRFAFVRSGRTPKVSCSLNGTRAKIVNCHMVSGGNAKLSFEGKDCVLKLTPGAVRRLVRRSCACL